MLDVATGTGDLALELARRVAPGGEVVGSDFSEGDARARAREGRARSRSVSALDAELRFEWGDALELPYAEDSFDAATVGFGAAQLRRPRPRAGRDGAGRAAREAGWWCSR